MSNNKVTDEWLYKTMPAIDEALINNLEKDVDFNHEFTSDFETRMQKLLTKEQTTTVKNRRLLRINKMAASVAAILVILSTTATSVLAYRIGLFTTIRTVWEDSVLYTYLFSEDNKSETVFEARNPDYIPEGYETIVEQRVDNLYTVTYENKEGKQIIWDQKLVSDAFSLILDNEYKWNRVIQINENELNVFGYDDGHVIAYYEYDRYIFMIMADDISMDDLKKMIKK